jgi:hypothetical protein
MTTLPAVTLEDGDTAAPVSSSVVRQIIARVWWLVCLLPALELLAIAAGR